MNSDSFVGVGSGFPSGHPFATLAVAGTTTSEQLFTVTGANTALIAVPSQTAVLGASTPADPNVNPALIVGNLGYNRNWGRTRPYFNSGSFDGRALRIRAMGTVFQNANTTNAQTVTFKITQGTAVSSTKVIATGASATNLASGSANWLLEATVLWDSATQAVLGEYWGSVGGSYVTRATLTNSPAVTAYSGLEFVCSVVFSTSNATSSAKLVEFSMEQV